MKSGKSDLLMYEHHYVMSMKRMERQENHRRRNLGTYEMFWNKVCLRGMCLEGEVFNKNVSYDFWLCYLNCDIEVVFLSHEKKNILFAFLFLFLNIRFGRKHNLQHRKYVSVLCPQHRK